MPFFLRRCSCHSYFQKVQYACFFRLAQYMHLDLNTKSEILIGKKYMWKSSCEFVSLSLSRNTFNKKKQFYKILLTNNVENKK